MKFKKFFASFVLFATLLTASFSATRRGSDLVPSGHWVYDALAQIEIDFGRWNFVDHTPLTIMELKGILQEIPYEKLSKPAQEQYLTYPAGDIIYVLEVILQGKAPRQLFLRKEGCYFF